MNPVPRNQIEATWEEICNLDQDGCAQMAQEMSNEQPFLLMYVVAQDQLSVEQDENSTMLSLAMLIWKLLKKTPSRQIGDRVIEKAEAKNIQFLEKMDASSELENTGAVAGLVNNYNQRELLGFCLEVLMAGHEETPDLAPEGIGIDLITLKTIMDCLDK